MNATAQAIKNEMKSRIQRMTDQQLTDAHTLAWKQLEADRTNRNIRLVCFAIDFEYYARFPEQIEA